jgi:hypothetical protein
MLIQRQESKSYPEKDTLKVVLQSLARQSTHSPTRDKSYFNDVCHDTISQDIYEYILEHGIIKKITIPEVGQES